MKGSIITVCMGLTMDFHIFGIAKCCSSWDSWTPDTGKEVILGGYGAGLQINAQLTKQSNLAHRYIGIATSPQP